jgi:hypothetical protein
MEIRTQKPQEYTSLNCIFSPENLGVSVILLERERERERERESHTCIISKYITFFLKVQSLDSFFRLYRDFLFFVRAVLVPDLPVLKLLSQ